MENSYRIFPLLRGVVAVLLLLLPVAVLGTVPTTADTTITANVTAPYTFSASDFPFSDVDGDVLAHIRIVTVETAGDLEYNGVDVVAGTTYNDPSLLTFTPNPEVYGAAWASFEFQVEDSAGEFSDTHTLTLDVVRNVDPRLFVNGGLVTGTLNLLIPVYEDSSYAFDSDYIISVSDPSIANESNPEFPIIVNLMASKGVLDIPGLSRFVAGDSTSNLTIVTTITQCNGFLNGIRYIPNANAMGVETITIRLNDQGNIGDFGGTDIYRYLTFNILPINDAPILSTTEIGAFTAIDEDEYSNPGDAVGDIIVSGSITDPDGAAVLSMAVAKVDNRYGSWEYSLNNGSTWSPISTTTGSIVNIITDALLLDGVSIGALTNRIRFVPALNFNGSAEIEFRAWDMSDVTQQSGDRVDIVAYGSGGETPFSVGQARARIKISEINDNPNLCVKGNAVEDWMYLPVEVDANLNYEFTSADSICVTDPDIGTYQLIVNLSVNKGILDFGTVSRFISGDRTNNVVIVTHLTEMNNFLSHFNYISNDGANGLEEIRVVMNDQGHTGPGDGEDVPRSIFIALTNDPPQFTSSPILSINEDEAYSYSVVAVDDTVNFGLTLSATTKPSWLTLTDNGDGTGTLHGSAPNSAVGMNHVVLTVTDGIADPVVQDFYIEVINVNDPPEVANPIPNQSAPEDFPWTYAFPANTFYDPDPGDELSYSAQLNGGSPLPVWMSFDSALRQFSGTPGSFDIGVYALAVTATDLVGETVTDVFNLTVTNTDDPPMVAIPIPDTLHEENAFFDYTFPVGTFADPDPGDVLTYSAQMQNGDALPAWLTFDAANRRFYGTPYTADIGKYYIRVIATDTTSLTADDVFLLWITWVNTAPFVVNPIADTTATEDQPFAYSYAADTFNDNNIIYGDTLTYTASLDDDTPLPAWLTFNGNTRSFSGTPLNEDVGVWQIKVTAHDAYNSMASDVFALTVINVNDPPALAYPVPDQTAQEDAYFSYTFPDTTFSDPDVGDSFTYTAKLSDGSPLPGWLHLDGATRTFSGTPHNADVQAWSVRLTATDTGSVSVNDVFIITVTNTNDAPYVVNPIADHVTLEDAVYSFTFLATTFADSDLVYGDVLHYTASLEGGAPLPAWLSFNGNTRTFNGVPRNEDIGVYNIAVTATDNSGASAQDVFQLEVLNTNDAPVVNNPIPDQLARETIPFTYIIAADAFVDVDPGDYLTYSAHSAGSVTLPGWLSFTPSLRRFNGTPDSTDIGYYTIEVTATDNFSESVTDSFIIEVRYLNDAPVLVSPIADQQTSQDAAWSFTFDAGTFSDANLWQGDQLTYSALMADRSPLPAWMSFNATTRTFSGTPGNADVGVYALSVTATDRDAATATDEFNLTVLNINDAPYLVTGIPNQLVFEDNLFDYTVPVGTFSDPDLIYGDHLAWSADLQDGSALPAWVSFDPATRHFTGTPTVTDLGDWYVRVTVTDDSLATANDVFRLRASDQPNTPYFVSWPDTNAVEDVMWTYNIVTADLDVASVRVIGANVLPDWLTLVDNGDGTGVLSGMPLNEHVGSHYVDLFVDDGVRLVGTQSFTIVVTNSNDAPYVLNPLPDRQVAQDHTLSFTVPTNTFADDDLGDSFTYSASLEDDSPLPAWAVFWGTGRLFVFSPSAGDVGTWNIKVKATDTFGAQAYDVFTLLVTPVINQAPWFTSTPVTTALEGQLYTYNVTAEDDSIFFGLTLTAPTLPAWLTFVDNGDGTGTLSGTPTNAEVGDHAVVLAASDGIADATTQSFTITVDNLNSEPYVALPIPDHTTFQDAAYAFTFNAGTFADPDVGDVLHYTASMSDGSALPSWLFFTPGTRTFSGLPHNADVGVYEIRVTATDNAGASVYDDFQLEVLNMNDAPTLANAIPDQPAVVGQTFDYIFPDNTFTDPDLPYGDELYYTVAQPGGAALPAWLTFTEGERRFTGTPGTADVGSLSVEVTATDTYSSSVTDTFVIQVYPTNAAPAFTSTPAYSATEDALYSYYIETSDDGINMGGIVLAAPVLPAWLTLADNGDGTGTLSGTPTNTNVGNHNVTLTVSDGIATAVQQNFVIEVINVNTAPYVAVVIPDQTAWEETPWSFAFDAGTFVDPDLGDELTYAVLYDGGTLPGWLTFSSATRTFEGTPANSDVGAHNIQVTATDLGGLSVSDTFTLNVENMPDAPYFTSTPVTTATEDALYSYYITTDDVDTGASLSINAPVLPTWLTLVDNGNGTATLSGTPLNENVGDNPVELTVDDGVRLTDTQSFTIVVTNTNDAPYVNVPLVDQQKVNTTTTTYTFAANSFADVDAGDELTYSASMSDGSTLEGWIDFIPATRAFTFSPTPGVEATYNLRVTATDLIGATVYDDFQLMVTSEVNLPPYFTSDPVTNATENDLYTYNVAAADDAINFGLEFGATVLPSWLTLVDNGDGTAVLSGTPLDANVGDNAVTLTVWDRIGGSTPTPQSFVINVANVNNAPYFTSTPVTTANEDQLYTYNITVADDGWDEGLSITAPVKPAWLILMDNGDGTAVLTGTPVNNQVGSYTIILQADDGMAEAVYQSYTLTVNNTEDAPYVADPLPDMTAYSDHLFNYTLPTGSFADDDLMWGDHLTYSATLAGGDALPAWLTFGVEGATVFYGVPSEADAGMFDVTVTATDDAGMSAADTFVLSVEGNIPPIFTSTPITQVYQGALYNYAITTYDPDDNQNLALFALVIPEWLTLTDNGTGTGTLTGTPGNSDVGQHEVQLWADDGVRRRDAVVQMFTITVLNVNDAPYVVTPIPNQNATAGAAWSYTFPEGTFADIDVDDVLSYSASGMPAWLSFNSGTHTFGGTAMLGTSNVTVIATDLAGATASDTFTLVVSAAPNNAPFFYTMPPTTATEGVAYTYGIEAMDDGVNAGGLVLGAIILPGWLLLDDNGNGLGTLYGTPGNADVGDNPVTLTVSDGLADPVEQSFIIVVSDVNVPPYVANAIPDQAAVIGEPWTYTFPENTFVDDDPGDVLTYTAIIPTIGDVSLIGLSFDGGTRTFSGTPTAALGYNPTIEVTATDLALTSASTTFHLHLNNTNSAPYFIGMPELIVTEGDEYLYNIVTVDDTVNFGGLVLSAPTLPSWLTLVDNGDGTGTLSGTPGNADVGEHSVVLGVSDGIAGLVTQSFTVTVVAVSEPPVVLNPIRDRYIYQGQPLDFQFAENTFYDPDAEDVLTYTAEMWDHTPLASWISFDAANRFFSGTPGNDEVGQWIVRVNATDLSGNTVYTTFDIYVWNVNDAPYLVNPLPDHSTLALTPYSFVIPPNTFADIDAGDTLSYKANLADGSVLPDWLAFDALTHTLYGLPDSTDVGSYSIEITVVDSAFAEASDVFVLTVSSSQHVPVVANPIPDQNAYEDTLYDFIFAENTFYDPDAGDHLRYTARQSNGDPLPAWLTFVPTQRRFTGTPTVNDAGSYTLLVIATDDYNTFAQDEFILTVNYVNDLPVFVTTPDTMAVQDQYYSYAPAATDIDVGDSMVLVGTTLPAWLTLVDNGDGTGLLSGTPGNDYVGDNLVVIVAVDSSAVPVEQSFVIHVANVNDAPYVAVPLPDSTIYTTIAWNWSLPVGSFTDPDLMWGDHLTYTADLADGNMLPAWLTFDGSAFTGTPLHENAGVYDIRVTATDDSLVAVSDVFTLNVMLSEEPPYFVSVPDTMATQDVEWVYSIVTMDDNGDALVLSLDDINPAWLTLVDNGDGTGTYYGTPTNNEVGDHNITLRVSDGIAPYVEQSFTLHVQNVNDAPVVLNPLVDQTATQDVAFAYTVPANTFDDVDIIYGDDLTISAALTDGNPLPVWLSFDGSAFSGTPANSDVGVYDIRVTATDMSSASVYDDFILTVQNVNDAPTIDVPASFSFAEDTQLTEDIAPYITDVDPDDVLTLMVTGNANIGVVVNGLVVTFSATLNWNGSENLIFTVNDNAGRAVASDTTLVTVTAVNDAPFVVYQIPAQTLYEDTPFSVAVPIGIFGDADIIYGDSLTLSATLADGNPLPAWVTFDGSTFSGTPTNEDVGVYVVRLTATDLAGATAYEDIEVTVQNVNDAPTIDVPASFSFAEDTQLTEDIAPYITDPDPDDVLTLMVTGNANIGVVVNGLVVTFSAPANWNGSENLIFTVNDNAGRAVASDTTLVTVTAVNDAPYVVTPLTDQTATQDVAFAYTVPANTFDDVDIIYGDALTLSAALTDGNPLPAWLSFYGDTFNGTPANSDVGAYDIRVTATDTEGASIYDDFILTVLNVNEPPTIDLPASFSFAEDTQLTEDIAPYITDPDPDDILTLMVTGNANIGVVVNGLVVTFSAPANWNGSENLIFTVNDNAGRAVASDTTLVTVTAVNDAPYVIITIPTQTIQEDVPFNITLPAGVFGDADLVYGDVLTLSATLANGDPLPAWVTFNGTTFSGMPTNADVGSYVVRLIATDLAGATAYEDITVNVLNLNDAPYLVNAIPAQTLYEDMPFSLTVPDNTFGDDDLIHGDVLTLTAALASGDPLPAWVTFDGTTFSGEASNADVGAYVLRLTATDTGGLSAYDDITVTVVNVNDAPYLANAIPAQTLYEDVAFSLTVPANTFGDDDLIHGDVLTLTAALASGDPLPAWVTFDGTTFSGTATNSDLGTYVVRLTATDVAGASAYDDINVTVLNTNDPPTIDLPATFSFAEDTQLTEDFAAYIADVDPDDVLTLTVSGNTNINVSITDLVVTFSATLNWNGSETLTFTVNDNAGRAVASDNTVVSVTYVNDTPYVANAISPITFNEDTVYSGLDLDNVFADYDLVYGDVLTYSYSGNTHIGVSIANGVVTLTPEPDWFGVETITFTATDNAGANVSTNASVTVVNVNDAPTIALPDAIEFDEDTQYTVDFTSYVNDIEQTPAQMTLTASGNTHISVSITGMNVTFTNAEANWNGSEVITFTIDDNQGGRTNMTVRSERQNESLAGSRLTASDETTVTVLYVNDAPYVAVPLADFEMQENTTDTSIDLDDVFGDVDLVYGDHLTYTYSGNTHIGVSIADGVVSLTPETDWYGAETITFTATDDYDASVSDDVTVTVINVIDVPQIDAIADTVLYEVYTAYSYQVTGYFFPSAAFSLTTAPEGMTIGETTGLIEWTPTGAQSGVHAVTVKAENTEGYHEVSYQITVINVNEAPTLIGDMFQDETAAMSWLPPANVTWLTGYRLYYSQDYYADYIMLAEFSETGSSYTHSAPAVGSKNFYKIAAVLTAGDWTGESEFSDVLIIYPVPHDEFALLYDDGTAEDGYYAPDAGVQFNAPERYVPETVVIKLAVYLWQKANDPLDVTIYRDAETVPGTEASSISYESSELVEGWNFLDVPASLQPVIMGGQFFVSVAMNPSSHMLGLDTSSEVSGHSYSDDGATWSPVNGNLMIRAVIATGLPRITASETSINFGDVFAGETSATETFTVTNVGNTDLDITSLTVPTGFEASLDGNTWQTSMAFTVAWNSEQTVYVRFVPTVRQLYTGNLVIESNDVDDTVINIALTGNAVEPMPNAFTPNGDGLNDTYVVKFTNGGNEAVRMRIYNTQGREVITIEGTANAPLVWDGRDKDGDECVANPYLMILERGGEIVKRGKVYLVR